MPACRATRASTQTHTTGADTEVGKGPRGKRRQSNVQLEIRAVNERHVCTESVAGKRPPRRKSTLSEGCGRQRLCRLCCHAVSDWCSGTVRAQFSSFGGVAWGDASLAPPTHRVQVAALYVLSRSIAIAAFAVFCEGAFYFGPAGLPFSWFWCHPLNPGATTPMIGSTTGCLFSGKRWSCVNRESAAPNTGCVWMRQRDCATW